jgi:hypothetical protein
MTSQWPNDPDDDGNAVHGFRFGCLLSLGIWLALGALIVAADLVRW